MEIQVGKQLIFSNFEGLIAQLACIIIIITLHSSYGPINPVPDSTWTFLKGLFTEIGQKVFMDDYLHLGGDEVSYGCW